jgi:hypothetical protein
MKLSYRGHCYSPAAVDCPTISHTFQGQFLGISAPFTIAYRSGIPDSVIPLTYRGQRYLSIR